MALLARYNEQKMFSLSAVNFCFDCANYFFLGRERKRVGSVLECQIPVWNNAGLFLSKLILFLLFDNSVYSEDNDKAITALQRKEALKVIDVDNSGKMSLIEYLLWKYKKTVGAVANASQGDNKEEIEACQRQIAEVQAALDDVLAKLEASKVAAANAQTALRECQAARAENEKKLAQQKVAVQESKSALIKVKAALEG